MLHTNCYSYCYRPCIHKAIHCYVLNHRIVSNGALFDYLIAALSRVVVSTLVLTRVTARQFLFTVCFTLEVERRDTAWHRLYVTTAR